MAIPEILERLPKASDAEPTPDKREFRDLNLTIPGFRPSSTLVSFDPTLPQKEYTKVDVVSPLATAPACFLTLALVSDINHHSKADKVMLVDGNTSAEADLIVARTPNIWEVETGGLPLLTKIATDHVLLSERVEAILAELRKTPEVFELPFGDARKKSKQIIEHHFPRPQLPKTHLFP